MDDRERRTERAPSRSGGTGQSRRRKKKRRRRKNRAGRILVIILIALAVIAAVLGISYAVGRYFAGNYLLDSNQAEVVVDKNSDTTVAVEIPKGASTRDIAKILKDNGIIKNELSFRLSSRLNDADGTYNYGTFYFTKDMSTDQIIKTLLTVTQAEESGRLTIPEGYTVKQIAALVDQLGIVSSDEFINEVNNGEFDYDFLEGIPDREYRLEGYLFPDTYFLSGNETARDIIVMMLDRFGQVYNESVSSYVSSSGYTLDQLVTVASMVESEAKLDEERPTIAGVIYNRLEIDMPLQIDSTVQYALSTKNEVVTYTDLEVDSPYNTYKNKGLPVGPICSPGKASIEAAVNPEKHSYIYYVLKEQGGSEHTFTVSYDDFLKAKAAYQATFNS
ncbi:MAG: endolytic transglycosylase MltG [Clostridia bacterium]|nr:endolytic transglycosylase MltG [Clostridia bacterium]